MSFLLDELSQIDVTNIERFWLANALNTFGAKLKQNTKESSTKGKDQYGRPPCSN
jgi:hypothetical protein